MEQSKRGTSAKSRSGAICKRHGASSAEHRVKSVIGTGQEWLKAEQSADNEECQASNME